MNKSRALGVWVFRALIWVPAVHAAGFQNYLEQGAAATGQADRQLRDRSRISSIMWALGITTFLMGLTRQTTSLMFDRIYPPNGGLWRKLFYAGEVQRAPHGDAHRRRCAG